MNHLIYYYNIKSKGHLLGRVRSEQLANHSGISAFRREMRGGFLFKVVL